MVMPGLTDRIWADKSPGRGEGGHVSSILESFGGAKEEILVLCTEGYTGPRAKGSFAEKASNCRPGPDQHCHANSRDEPTTDAKSINLI